jgi:putative nucleotidyltransferase with HDIG domain
MNTSGSGSGGSATNGGASGRTPPLSPFALFQGATDGTSPLGILTVHGILFALISALGGEVVFQGLAIHQGAMLPGGLAAIGRVVTLFVTFFFLLRFVAISTRSYRPTVRDLSTLTITVLASVLMVWLGQLIGESVSAFFRNQTGSNSVPAEALIFAIPYASGAILLQAVLGFHYGLLFSLTMALLMAVYSPAPSVVAPFVLVTCLVGCLSLSRFRSRSANLKAGMNIIVVALPFSLAYLLSSPTLAASAGFAALISAFLGGVLCIFVASGSAPVIEHLGGYVTDMRLIEMATLDHPLLRELSVQAPGTWNHSMVMGMMAESAAEAIGANPVLARVGAYFHDSGKIKKPLYFVENQAPGENRHDKLSTSMSALIIRSHVKDGIELARKHGLPKALEDMIPQHHGTSRIEFFFDKACREAVESGLPEDSVDESLYRYPGPRPQTREAGILMLADGIEAAARTLSDPTHDRIQGMVQKLINKVFSSGELNECDLTLKDLNHIARCFTRVLTGIYHQRIAYQEPAEKTNEAESEEEAAPALVDEQGEESDTASENLKRLGM